MIATVMLCDVIYQASVYKYIKCYDIGLLYVFIGIGIYKCKRKPFREPIDFCSHNFHRFSPGDALITSLYQCLFPSRLKYTVY